MKEQKKKACDDTCATCKDSAKKCVTCNKTGQYKFQDGSTCVQNCPAKKFANTEQACTGACDKILATYLLKKVQYRQCLYRYKCVYAWVWPR